MFDNLREKLGSFRSEAEEAAEENVEAVEADDLEGVEEPADAPVADEAAPSDPGTAPSDAEGARSEAEGAGSEVEGASVAEGAGSETEGAPVAEGGPSAAERAGTEGPTDAEPSTDSEPSSAAASAPPSAVADDATGGEPESADAPTSADPRSTSADATGGEPESASDESGGGLGFGRKAASMVRGKFVIEEADLEGPLQELEIALLSSDVELTVAREIVENLREDLVGETRTFTTSTGAVVEAALKDAIRDVISVGQFDFEARVGAAEKPLVIAFTGVNGVGKTTSIAKLDRWFEERGYSTVMANGDTYRAGANEQIREHAAARGTKLISHERGGDPAAVLYDAVEYAEANDVDVVLGDTAGRLHTDDDLMAQLEKIGRVVDPDMTLFVDEAVAGQDAVNRAREFGEAIEFDGAILTKADADANGGAAISIAHVTGKPILFLGVGQGYDDLVRFDPDEMVERLLAED